MNAKLFSDARAHRLPYTPKAKRAAAPGAPAKPRKRRTIGAQLNPLQTALLKKLELAGECPRFWPLRGNQVSRLYLSPFITHAQIFLTFSDPGTLLEPRLHVQFASQDPEASADQTQARKLLEQHYAPALQLCQELRTKYLKENPGC